MIIDAVRTRTPKIDCSVARACRPWPGRGSACSRRNNINLQFMMNLAPENYVIDYSYEYNLSQVTYAFCPRVDEIQAFNLSGAFKLGATYYSTIAPDGSSTGSEAQANNSEPRYLRLSDQLEIGYLSIYGMGDTSNILFPASNTSYGSVGVIFNTTSCNYGEFGIVSFLIVNITMKNGKYLYSNDVPIKTGFSPSCVNNVCLFDPSMKCFGEPDKANCGTCISDPEIIANTTLQVWVSYYGTDSLGVKLLSGASNPLNFRAFSGGGVYNAYTRAQERWNGEVTPDDLEP